MELIELTTLTKTKAAIVGACSPNGHSRFGPFGVDANLVIGWESISPWVHEMGGNTGMGTRLLRANLVIGIVRNQFSEIVYDWRAPLQEGHPPN